MASRSRWLVGSSKMRMLGLVRMSLQKTSRACSPPRQRLGRLVAFFAAEKHLAEDAANLFDVGRGVPAMQPLGDGEAVLDGCADVLREVADLRLVAPEDGAGVEREFLVGEAGIVGQQALEQGGLAGAVAAHEADFFAAQHVGGEAVDDLLIAVELGEVLELENVLAAGPDLIETDVGALDVGAGQFVGLQALDFLAAAGDLRGARAGGEAGDELVELGDLLFALRVLRLRAWSGSASWPSPSRRSRRCR